jgi:hypothetical protein
MRPSQSQDIRLKATVQTRASPAALAELPFDFDRYVEVEPRLRSARWLDGHGPHLGARAEVVADIPYRVPLVRLVFGAPEAVATITTWDPPRRVAVSFEARRFFGSSEIEIEACDNGAQVVIDGAATPRAQMGTRILRPVKPVIERLATRALERGIRRAAAALMDGVR